MAIEIRSLSPIRADVGEGPLWNSKTQIITWVDITGLKWHQTNYETGATATREVSNMVGAIVERKNGGFFAAVKEGFAELNSTLGYTVTNEFLPAPERMNDAKADALGRWWCGSNAIDFTSGSGRLHVIDENHKVTTKVTGLTLPNGLAWNDSNSEFYLVDTFESCLWAFDFDLDSAELSNKRQLVKFKDDGSYPDGMTISDEGYLIIAMWDGARLEVYDTKGKKQSEILMPVKKPTSCTFGGPDSNTLIVTSACREVELQDYSLDGQLLAVSETGLTGKASTKFNG